MPRKKAAIKSLRQSTKKAVKNAKVKHNIRELVKKIKRASQDNKSAEDLKKLVHALQKAVDKAVKSKVLPANTGNRRKSRTAAWLKTGKTPATK